MHSVPSPPGSCAPVTSPTIEAQLPRAPQPFQPSLKLSPDCTTTTQQSIKCLEETRLSASHTPGHLSRRSQGSPGLVLADTGARGASVWVCVCQGARATSTSSPGKGSQRPTAHKETPPDQRSRLPTTEPDHRATRTQCLFTQGSPAPQDLKSHQLLHNSFPRTTEITDSTPPCPGISLWAQSCLASPCATAPPPTRVPAHGSKGSSRRQPSESNPRSSTWTRVHNQPVSRGRRPGAPSIPSTAPAPQGRLESAGAQSQLSGARVGSGFPAGSA